MEQIQTQRLEVRPQGRLAEDLRRLYGDERIFVQDAIQRLKNAPGVELEELPHQPIIKGFGPDMRVTVKGSDEMWASSTLRGYHFDGGPNWIIVYKKYYWEEEELFVQPYFGSWTAAFHSIDSWFPGLNAREIFEQGVLEGLGYTSQPVTGLAPIVLLPLDNSSQWRFVSYQDET